MAAVGAAKAMKALMASIRAPMSALWSGEAPSGAGAPGAAGALLGAEAPRVGAGALVGAVADGAGAG